MTVYGLNPFEPMLNCDSMSTARLEIGLGVQYLVSMTLDEDTVMSLGDQQHG